MAKGKKIMECECEWMVVHNTETDSSIAVSRINDQTMVIEMFDACGKPVNECRLNLGDIGWLFGVLQVAKVSNKAL